MTYKILLVDGDAARAAKRRGPLADAGHEVNVAGSPDAALLSFERSTPHLVVIDATQGEATIRDLCGLLKKQAPHVPLVLLTDVVRDPQQIALLLNQYGCDQLIDRSLAPDRMLRLVGQLVDAQKAGSSGRPTQGATDSAGATLWLDSEELVNALEKLDTIITHKAASHVQASGHAPAQTTPSTEIQVNVDAQVDRDVPARRPTDDGGSDIDDHLDTVFSRGRSAVSPPSPPTPPAPPREPVVVKATQALRSAQAQSPARDAGVTLALPVQPRHGSPARDAKAPAASARTVEAPRAEALRSDVAISLQPQAPASTMRWFVVATVVVTLLGAGYLVLFRSTPHTAPVSVASNGSSPTQPPPFTPAADGAADSSSDVRSAGSTVPVVPPTAAPAATAPPAPKPAATPKPTPAPKLVAKAQPTPKPAAKSQKPKATPAPKPSPKPAVPEPPAVAAAPVAAPSAPEPVPMPPAPEPTAAPLVAAAEPKPARTEPGPIVPATVLKRVEPTYSPKAVKGIGDPRVVLRVLVDPQGRITRVLVDKGLPGSDLEAAAVSAILRWQFRPATQDGKAVESWATAEFRFRE